MADDRAGSDWTHTEVERVKADRQAGVSFEETARAIGRSADAVRDKGAELQRTEAPNTHPDAKAGQPPVSKD